jgi:hypothetical protein
MSSEPPCVQHVHEMHPAQSALDGQVVVETPRLKAVQPQVKWNVRFEGLIVPVANGSDGEQNKNSLRDKTYHTTVGVKVRVPCFHHYTGLDVDYDKWECMDRGEDI